MSTKAIPHEDANLTVKTVLLDISFMEWSVLTGVCSAIVVLFVNLLQ